MLALLQTFVLALLLVFVLAFVLWLTLVIMVHYVSCEWIPCFRFRLLTSLFNGMINNSSSGLS